jgi:hypothetical protein
MLSLSGEPARVKKNRNDFAQTTRLADENQGNGGSVAVVMSSP